ncbi:hypothetical protein OXB_2866 [Bacillus sp. OxB-1]|uniref:hypothetical protein n=1 Tax=Bacillus sp. (strain OxB-1) TaxID=98228 RepID=UPI000581E4CC|nr:hypothetical protein [Bacillus sp. OxB-1]BAQ11337.1 hypothetical protein OXB_2866 [Bacillus sp. OxB-1]
MTTETNAERLARFKAEWHGDDDLQGDDIDWLIQQAERTAELESHAIGLNIQLNSAIKFNAQIKEENASLREALEEIASTDGWETVDEARNLARQALKGEYE